MSYQNDKALIEWLESLSSEEYQRSCQKSFLTFLDFLNEQGWTNPSGDSILDRHKQNRKSGDNKIKYELDDFIPKFIQWLKESRGLKHNSAINKSAPIRGFFKFHREPLRIQKSSNIIYKKTKFHIFTKEELSRMVRLGDVEEKAIILLGKDLGIRVSDFMKIKRSPIIEAFKDQKGDFPIEFEIRSNKGSVVAIGHIMQETWEILQNYWSNIPQSEYAFPSNSSHISEYKVNYLIKNAWNRAYPDRQDVQTRFQELRNFKMTALNDCGINEWHIKRMIGKKLSSDISTYLRGINLKNDFRKAMPKMQLSGLFTTNQEKIEELILALMQIEKENRAFKTRIDNMQKTVERLEQLLKDNQNEFQRMTTKINGRLDWLEIQTKKKEKMFFD
jgi:integrase